MGQATREATLRIYRSLLALGVFEQNDQTLSRDDIIGKLECVNIKTSEEAKRLIKTINIWLEDESEIKEIKDHRALWYKVNFDNISSDKYKDCLDVLLSLYEIGNRQFDTGINILYNKEGQGALGIISKLILATKMTNSTDRKLVLEYQGFEGEFIFRPHNLIKNEYGHWVVNGDIPNNNTGLTSPLDISNIISIRDPL